jgi:GntR family transcriptional regulator, arabinose operon transcriptional repressor
MPSQRQPGPQTSQRHASQIRSDIPISVPHQLLAILMTQIRQGKYPPGRRFPPERVLAEEFKISRASVRETVTQMITQGVLARVHGRGTFVAEPTTERAQRASSSRQIGFWISERIFHFVQPGYNQILSGSAEVCRLADCWLRFYPISDSGSVLDADTLDGSIVVGGLRRDLMEQLSQSAKPLFLVDFLNSSDQTSVSIDYPAGTRAAIDHLYELGHRNIGFVGFPNSAKYDAYWKSLSRHGLAYHPEYVEFFDSSALVPGMLAGFRAMQNLLSRNRDRPTAMVITNDNAAVGALEALEIAGVSVPEDMSIVGYDDLGAPTTTLTTLRADLVQVGRIAATALLQWIDSGSRPENPSTVPVELIIRASTSAPCSLEAAPPIESTTLASGKLPVKR